MKNNFIYFVPKGMTILKELKFVKNKFKNLDFVIFVPLCVDD